MPMQLRVLLHSHKEKDVGPPSDSHFYQPYIGTGQVLVILDLLERLKPRKCFEWGSGWSTVFFPRFIPQESIWISIEHLGSFVNLLTPHLLPNVKIIKRRLGDTYVREALNWVKGQPFDFVFIDGEGRKECLEIALKILRKGGIAVQHDKRPDPGIPEKFEEQGVVQNLWWGRK